MLLRSTVVFGGIDIKTQKPELMKGIEILVATPGRLLDHVESKNLMLNQVQVLILDEADRMLDMGFMPDLKRILTLLPKQRQTLLFSATFSDDIKKLAQDFLVNPVTVEAERRNTAAENVKQSVLLVDQDNKFNVLADQIRSRGVKQVLVFTRTKLLRQASQRCWSAAASLPMPFTATRASRSASRRWMLSRKARLPRWWRPMLPRADWISTNCRWWSITNCRPTPKTMCTASVAPVAQALAAKRCHWWMDKEERLLKDIEKLLKREFPRERAIVTPIAHASSSHKAARYSTPAHGKKTTPEEDWFMKPYEPSPVAPKIEEQPSVREDKPKKQVAALFRRSVES